MNYLAHFHLAWPDEGLLAGGLEGDYYKGPLRGDLPPDIERGVRLHRAIDGYTDRHPAVARLREVFPDRLRRYAGILADLSFDHFLSRHWQRFSNVPQPDFNAGVYRSLRAREQALSEGARRMLGRMEQHDILGLYHDWDTVPASAARIGERFRRHNPFTDLERDLAPARDQLERAFLEFYPDLQDYSARAIEQMN